MNACLKSSSLWHSIQTLNLGTNMTAHLRNTENINFPEKLLKLGEGILRFPNGNSSQVLLDNGLGQIVQSLETLIDTLCNRIENYIQRNFDCFCSRTIVSPRNDTVNETNKIIIEKVLSNFKYYKYIDTV